MPDRGRKWALKSLENFRGLASLTSALRPDFVLSHRRRLDLKSTVRSARHNGEKLGARRMALPPPLDDR